MTRRYLTEPEWEEVLGAIAAARDGGVGRIRFVSPEDREFFRQRVLQQARRLGIRVRTVGKGARGDLLVTV